MKNLFLNLFNIKTKVFLFLAVATLLASCEKDKDTDMTPMPSATQISNESVAVPFFVRNDNQEMPTDDSDLLYTAMLNNPVLAPDGHQLTWGEFASVQGEAKAECMEDGTKVTLTLTGLIPYGQYTLWTLVFDEPGMDPSLPRLGSEGVGATGIGDGSDNAFVANGAGEASITVTSPGGDLSLVGTAGNCALTDHFEYHVVGLYHIDGRTYGGEKGPAGTFAEQFGFIFNGQN